MTGSAPLIAAAMASFNRRETTLACLSSLHRQTGCGRDFRLSMVLLDDASTDGTAQAVAANFPDVTLLEGTGSLYWGGGMHRAMSHALASDPDFILLMNDDVQLRPNALQSVLSVHRQLTRERGNSRIAVIGATVQPGTGRITYSGFRRTAATDPSKLRRIAALGDKPVRCDTMNGNFVLVPRAAAQVLGPVDSRFPHQLGDIDYGYRLNAAGGETWVSPAIAGECSANCRKPPVEAPGLSLRERWRALNTPKGLPLRSWAVFMWRHGGAAGIIRLCGIYVKKLAAK